MLTPPSSHNAANGSPLNGGAAPFTPGPSTTAPFAGSANPFGPGNPAGTTGAMGGFGGGGGSVGGVWRSSPGLRWGTTAVLVVVALLVASRIDLPHFFGSPDQSAAARPTSTSASSSSTSSYGATTTAAQPGGPTPHLVNGEPCASDASQAAGGPATLSHRYLSTNFHVLVCQTATGQKALYVENRSVPSQHYAVAAYKNGTGWVASDAGGRTEVDSTRLQVTKGGKTITDEPIVLEK